MSLSIDEQDRINQRLRRAQAITVLIAQAASDGADNRGTVRTAAYLADELIEEAHGVIEAACRPKRADS